MQIINYRYNPIHLNRAIWISILLLAITLTGCDSLFGSKNDDTTEEIFDAGRLDPTLLNEVEYVPLFPFFTQSGDGQPLSAPRDVYIGYDEFIYIVDDRGLHVLDRAGRPALFTAIEGGATNVIQDRKLNIYVTARKDTLVNGRVWNLPVIYNFADITTGSPRLVNTIWHPFDEESRRFNLPDPIDTDEQVEFTGLAILFNNDDEFDNSLYVSRRGPVNERASIIRPHNTILEFDSQGINTQAIVALNPNNESLLSAINPTDIITSVHPPQRTSFNESKSFILAQSPDPQGMPSSGAAPLRFGVLSVRAVVTPDGIEYQPDTNQLLNAGNPARGDGFLYDEFKFINPSALAVAADETNYIFVMDSGKDSLFVFTSSGIEGVAPPPGSQSTKPVVVSFGGTGDGASNFNNPNGIAYFDRIVYVADTGNNRISRYRLNTDFE